MMTVAMLFVGSSLLLKTANGVPNLDVKSTCSAAIKLAGVTGRTVESCVAGETAARKELEKDWSQFPSEERNRCISTSARGHSPSYVELLICLDMLRDSRKRQEEVPASQKKKSTSKP
jgi:hypothetical protein